MGVDKDEMGWLVKPAGNSLFCGIKMLGVGEGEDEEVAKGTSIVGIELLVAWELEVDGVEGRMAWIVEDVAKGTLICGREMSLSWGWIKMRLIDELLVWLSDGPSWREKKMRKSAKILVH